MAETISLGRGTTVFDSGVITVGNTAADLVTLILGGQVKRRLHMQVETTVQAITSFVIQLQDHPDGEFYDYLSDADFNSTSIANLLFVTATGPQEVAAAGKAHAIVEVHNAYAVKLRATCGGAGGQVRVRGQAGREH